MSAPKFTLYTDSASQWAFVPHLAIDENGYAPSDYEAKQVGLLDAENFNPEYVRNVNPNGTIPSLAAPSLSKPLIESADTVKFVDANRPGGASLFPADPAQLAKVEDLITHVHQDKFMTTFLLTQAVDAQEWEGKKNGFIGAYVARRQDKLERYGAANPDLPLYAERAPVNARLHAIYQADAVGADHEAFFEATRQTYRDFAAELAELDEKLVLPFAAGDEFTAADVHIVPWFAHALWAAGGKEVDELEPFRALFRKSVPDFEFGEKTKAWWANVLARESVKKNYPNLH